MNSFLLYWWRSSRKHLCFLENEEMPCQSTCSPSSTPPYPFSEFLYSAIYCRSSPCPSLCCWFSLPFSGRQERVRISQWLHIHMICRHICWRWGNRTALDWTFQNRSHLLFDHWWCSILSNLFHSCSKEAENLTRRHYTDPFCPFWPTSFASCSIHKSSQFPSDH